MLAIPKYIEEKRFKEFIEKSLEKGEIDYALFANSSLINDINPIKREFVLRRYLEKGAKGIEPYNSKIENIQSIIEKNRNTKKSKNLSVDLQDTFQHLYTICDDKYELDQLVLLVDEWNKKLQKKGLLKGIFGFL